MVKTEGRKRCKGWVLINHVRWAVTVLPADTHSPFPWSSSRCTWQAQLFLPSVQELKMGLYFKLQGFQCDSYQTYQNSKFALSQWLIQEWIWTQLVQQLHLTNYKSWLRDRHVTQVCPFLMNTWNYREVNRKRSPWPLLGDNMKLELL